MKTVNLTEEEHAELLALRAKNKTKASAPSPQDVVRAAGTSEGAKKGWEHRFSLSQSAHEATKKAFGSVDSEGEWDHWMEAARLHRAAAHAYKTAPASGVDKTENESHAALHENLARHHDQVADNIKASDPTQPDVIHCRSHASAAGSVLAAEKAWNPGEPVEFMWMPAGKHTICAGFRNGSIELTVNCDEKTAANVQASLEAWRNERPKQEPFGCIEHREHEASVRVSAQQAFSFKDDGVYIAAEPTALGAQNVNGKVHRSWSPSFTTDADYGAAKTVKTASGATVMVFPEGVRGSRSNPAEITGVDFCVGTLTNKPAFHAMSPVKSSEVSLTVTMSDGEVIKYDSDGAKVLASGTSEGAKKGWENRHKLISDIHQHLHGGEGEVYSSSFSTGEGHPAGGGRQVSLLNAHGAADSGGHYSNDAVLTHFHDTGETHLDLHSSVHESAKKAGLIPEGSKLIRKPEGAGRNNFTYKLPSDKAKASDASDPESIHAHCRATLLQDVPDATDAEVACYEKCIDEGGSHVTAVAEIRAQRKPEHVTQTAKATLEEVYDKVTGAGTSEGAEKGWEKRKKHILKNHDVYQELKSKLRVASKRFSNASGEGDSRNSHLERRELWSRMSEIEESAEKEAKSAAVSASEPVTPDTIAARQQAAMVRANELAASKGVARKTVDEVYAKLNGEPVQATWSDAARKAAAEARKRAHPNVNRLHDEHFGLNSHNDDSGYYTHSKKWLSPQRTHAAMSEAHDLGEGGGSPKELDELIKEHTGHKTYDDAAKDNSGAYNSSRKWLSVAKHAEAIKDAWSHGRDSLSDDDDETRASDALDLESIYARAGANR